VIVVAWVVSVAVLVLAAVLRAGTASLVRTPRADALRAAADGVAGADEVAKLLEERTNLQPSLGTTTTFLIVAAVIPLTWAITDSLSGPPLAFALVGMTVALVVLVDVVPRLIGRNRPGSLAYRLSRVLRVGYTVGSAASDLIVDADEEPELEEIETLGDESERELIMSVIEFTETIVREVMVPRTDMITIPGDASTDDAVDLVLSSGRSRIPVTGDSIDHVLGVLYARDLLEMFDREAAPRSTAELAHPAYFVPETKQVAELLREMQANQQHLSVVVDEFGGTAGIVTIEDLVEEIVGEIADEYDEEEPMIVEDADGWVVDARLGVDELAEFVGTELPSDEWDTVGGLVLELAGRVPDEGERFDHADLVFTATAVQGRRVSKVHVSRS
jgi:CBS domain containing-hemolysin-like protein